MNSVRRTLAIAGLLALGLIGYQLMLGQITMVAAAQRATAVMVALRSLTRRSRQPRVEEKSDYKVRVHEGFKSGP